MANTYQGITRQGNGWRAQILRGAKLYYIGSFDTDTQAAKAYDRVAALTTPFTKRRTIYNFEPPTAAELEEFVLPIERAILDDLKTRYPEQIDHSLRRDDDARYVPDVFLNDLSEIGNRVNAFGHNLGLFIQDAERAVKSFAAQLREKDSTITFYRNQVEALEKKVEELSKANKPAPLFTMRKVTPAGLGEEIILKPKQSENWVPADPYPEHVKEMKAIAKTAPAPTGPVGKFVET